MSGSAPELRLVPVPLPQAPPRLRLLLPRCTLAPQSRSNDRNRNFSYPHRQRRLPSSNSSSQHVMSSLLRTSAAFLLQLEPRLRVPKPPQRPVSHARLAGQLPPLCVNALGPRQVHARHLSLRALVTLQFPRRLLALRVHSSSRSSQPRRSVTSFRALRLSVGVAL